jgi:integrase
VRHERAGDNGVTFDLVIENGLRGGANLVAVSGLLRHASTRMTERYLHVTRADLRAAVEAGANRSGARGLNLAMNQSSHLEEEVLANQSPMG